ncbi:unnamed protein product [Caenorhabditis angaria]|uniref:CUB domain-containing protein n=1 Tax=Caenorhabditis angaria TaxID=860376 RepID=A0A9P1N620_9PELO|nr:unnamed protein product [Caenorhabditis angaria]
MLLLFLTFFGAVTAANECLPGWIFHPETTECYYISKILYKFDDSVSYCDSIGGKSASVSSSIELSAFTSIFNSSILQPWIGSRRNTTNNKFYNLDNSYFSTYFWATNEPSVNGDCVTYRGIGSVGLQVSQCYQLQPAFCKQTPALCNSGNFTGTSGTILSPGYPTQYYNNLKCTYLITSPDNTYITLNFQPFLIEEWYDSVKVYEGNSSVFANFIGQVSQYYPYTFETKANQALVLFTTDYRYTERGWQLNWSSKKVQPPISQSGTNGTLSSPNYPSNYNTYDEQIYYISTSFGTQVNLTIDDFWTESNRDFLEIYNSSTLSNSTLVAKLSGKNIAPYNIISPRSYLSLRFTSDGSLQYKGFHAFWNMF